MSLSRLSGVLAAPLAAALVLAGCSAGRMFGVYDSMDGFTGRQG